MILEDSEFAKEALGRAGEQAAPGNAHERFEPQVFYNRDGDCIEFLARPESYRAERIDGCVTAYVSHESGEVIGGQIKRAREFKDILLQRLPGFRIEFHDGKVALSLLFRARAWSSEADTDALPGIAYYRKLIQIAEESNVDADFECV